jgi:hypothetical protein
VVQNLVQDGWQAAERKKTKKNLKNRRRWEKKKAVTWVKVSVRGKSGFMSMSDWLADGKPPLPVFTSNDAFAEAVDEVMAGAGSEKSMSISVWPTMGVGGAEKRTVTGLAGAQSESRVSWRLCGSWELWNYVRRQKKAI